jgi:hypothetical protein
MFPPNNEIIILNYASKSNTGAARSHGIARSQYPCGSWLDVFYQV